ncbi:MAG: 2Fe-2S iron-sulfur cluster-binding protein [Actinomycetota bacterium]|nr:2Fe-2S iron-sulfur cluster-binding protein [Actinomycetota bacterium]
MALVRVLPDDIELEVREGEAILDAIRRAGYRCRYGCRRGGCGQCKADLVAGRLRYVATVAESVLAPEEAERGVCLLCRSTPVGEEAAVVVLREEGLRRVSPFVLGRPQQAPGGPGDAPAVRGAVPPEPAAADLASPRPPRPEHRDGSMAGVP